MQVFAIKVSHRETDRKISLGYQKSSCPTSVGYLPWAGRWHHGHLKKEATVSG